MSPSRLTLLMFLWLLGCSLPTASASLKPPVAQKGVIDLRDWPLNTQGPVSLRGEWRFRWAEAGKPGLIEVPGRWERLNHLPPWQTRFGEGEYSLKLLLATDDLNQPLQLSSRLISTRFQCSINDQLVGQSGLSLPGPIATSRQNVFRPFIPTQTELTLSCRVSNDSYVNSGILEPVMLGPVIGIQQERARRDNRLSLMLGFVLFIAIYHLLLAALSPDRLLLWYGLNSLFNLIYYDFLYLNLFESNLGIADFELNLRVVRLMLYINPLFFNAYLSQLFPDEINQTWIRFNNLATLPLIIATLILPASLHAPTVLLHGLLLVSNMSMWLLLMIQAARHHREGAWFFVVGMTTIIITALMDGLFTLGFQTVPGQVIYGFVVFLLSQALLIARRYTRARQESERLSVSLGQLAESLEARVEERTRQLKAQTENVEALSRFKDSISQMFIHDLKNPLAVIVAQQTPNIQAWRRVRAAASQMQQLVLNLLDTSRYRQVGLQLNLRTQDFSELLSAALSELEYFASQRRLELLERIDAHYRLECDGELIRRVLVNLLSNAIRHAPTGSQIRLEAHQDQTGLLFSIHDQGPGITPDQQAQIFEPFVRFSAGEMTELASSGLGLSFCKLVLDAHGGSIGIDSEVGQGTRVWFRLPQATRLATVPQSVNLQSVVGHRLSVPTLQTLRPFALRLQKSEIHEISTIRQISRELQPLAEDAAEVAEWRRQLMLCCDTFDETSFLALIQAVLTEDRPELFTDTPEAHR